jgi:hypothetical protein
MVHLLAVFSSPFSSLAPSFFLSKNISFFLIDFFYQTHTKRLSSNVTPNVVFLPGIGKIPARKQIFNMYITYNGLAGQVRVVLGSFTLVSSWIGPADRRRPCALFSFDAADWFLSRRGAVGHTTYIAL